MENNNNINNNQNTESEKMYFDVNIEKCRHSFKKTQMECLF
jgi:hypothetical protein